MVEYSTDLPEASKVTAAAIARTEGVLPGTEDVVVRALWDTTAGHLHAGVLMEGRYRIADVRHRTRIRSRVLTNLVHDLGQAGITLARPHVTLEK